MIARAVISSQSGSTMPWVPQTLDALVNIIIPPSGTSSPPLFINAACYTIHRIWSLHTTEATQHLDGSLYEPLELSVDTRDEEHVQHDPHPGVQRAIHTISALSIHTPFSPEFLDYLIGQNLSTLLSLRHYLIDLDAPIEISTPTAKSPEGDGTSDLPEIIHQILLSWMRDVELEEGIKRISEAIEKDKLDVQMLKEIIAGAERPDLRSGLARKDSEVETASPESPVVDDMARTLRGMALHI